MRCPSCRSEDNKVIDSRMTEGGDAIRRRRVCQVCHRRFTTKERLEEDPRLTVIKSNLSRVPYRRENVLEGMERACYKLPITEEQMRGAVERVEEELFREFDREVRSEDIGRIVARQLRRLHPVAYVRFMSVYRKFDSVEQFVEEIQDIKSRVAHETPAQPSLFEE